MKTRPVSFGHLVPKFRSDEELFHELNKPDGLLRRYDGQRIKPLLPPPRIQASLGLSFVLPGQNRHLYEAVAWAGYWLKREFAYDGAMFQPEIWVGPGWREAFIYVVDTQRGVRVVGAGACQLAQYSNLPAMRELAFVWFHPHFRRRGYLSGIWPAIAQKWGPFILQHPVSEGMRNFLARQIHGYVETTDGKADKIETYG